jgi:hypothetical protein
VIISPTFRKQFEITECFLPALFRDTLDGKDDVRLLLHGLPVKHAGMAIPDPTKSAKSNYEASSLVTSHLFAALTGSKAFRSQEHVAVMTDVKSEVKSRKQTTDDRTLKSILSKLPCDVSRAIARGKKTGQWLSVMPSTINGTDLAAQEFRDALLLRFARTPGDLQSHCDGCGQKNSVQHAHECKNGGNVIMRHNEVAYTVGDLFSMALTPSAVRNEPLINSGCPAVTVKDVNPSNPALTHNLHKNQGGDLRGDLCIRGAWEKPVSCVVDISITDTDAKSNISRDPAKVLEAREKEKKRKYLALCLQNRRHFTPFVVSTDGLIGKEAKALLQRLSSLLAEKWEKPYSVVCGYVNARVSIAIVRATHLCLRGSRVPFSHFSSRRPQWEDKAGLSLFRHSS